LKIINNINNNIHILNDIYNYHSIFTLFFHVMACQLETFAKIKIKDFQQNENLDILQSDRLGILNPSDLLQSEQTVYPDEDQEIQFKELEIQPEQFIETGIIKMGQIRIAEYTLLNIILRINIILSKSHITYKFIEKEFKWDCYWFNKGKYCKFFIKIYKDKDPDTLRVCQKASDPDTLRVCQKASDQYIIDITKTSNIHFIFTNFVKLFHIYFKNIYEIKQNECYSNYLLLDNNSNEMLSGVYILAIDQISQETNQTNIINSLEFLLEIFEYSNYHEYIINSGLQHNIIYLLFQLEYDKEENYHSIDMILYLLYLLSNTQIGKNAINKQQMLIDYLNKKIHQDLQYYEVYTLELSHLILANIK